VQGPYVLLCTSTPQAIVQHCSFVVCWAGFDLFNCSLLHYCITILTVSHCCYIIGFLFALLFRNMIRFYNQQPMMFDYALMKKCCQPSDSGVCTVFICVLSYSITAPFVCSCRRWVQASGREDLIPKSVEYLHANCKLCADHFEDDQFMNAVARNKLVWNAVPTIFAAPDRPKQLARTRKPPLKCSDDHLVKKATNKRPDGTFIILFFASGIAIRWAEWIIAEGPNVSGIEGSRVPFVLFSTYTAKFSNLVPPLLSLQ